MSLSESEAVGRVRQFYGAKDAANVKATLMASPGSRRFIDERSRPGRSTLRTSKCQATVCDRAREPAPDRAWSPLMKSLEVFISPKTGQILVARTPWPEGAPGAVPRCAPFPTVDEYERQPGVSLRFVALPSAAPKITLSEGDPPHPGRRCGGQTDDRVLRGRGGC